MSTATDLSRERLDELCGEYVTTDGTVRIEVEVLAALIAMAKRTEQAERERDAWRAFARGTDVWDYEGLCACCHETDHTPDCLWTIADLAQPTTEGGE